MKKFLKQVLLYGGILFLLLNLISFCCLYFLGKSNFYKQQFVKNYQLTTSFDYVVLGSSTGLTTLDTKLIDSVTLKKGLNISMDDSALRSQYLMLKHFYNSGKDTKCVILSVMPDDLKNKSPQLGTNDYRFLTQIWDDDVFNHFLEDGKLGVNVFTLSRYFPLIGISYYNTELFYPSLLSILNKEKKNRFDAKGNYSYPENAGFNYKFNSEQELVSVSILNPYFDLLVQFCKENNINLLLYQSPIYQKQVLYDTSFPIINHSNLYAKRDIFYDSIHVNSKGRIYCTRSFIENFLRISNDCNLN